MRRLALMWTLSFLIGKNINHCLYIHDQLSDLDPSQSCFCCVHVVPPSVLPELSVWSYIVMQLSVFLCSVLKPSFVFPFVVFRSWLCLPFPLCTPVLPQPLSPEPACLTSLAGAHRVSTGVPPGWHHTSVCLAHAPPLGYCPPVATHIWTTGSSFSINSPDCFIF